MKLKPNRKVRATLYIITAIGTPVVAYLESQGIAGTAEVALWSAEVTVVSAIAGFNLNKDE